MFAARFGQRGWQHLTKDQPKPMIPRFAGRALIGPALDLARDIAPERIVVKPAL